MFLYNDMLDNTKDVRWYQKVELWLYKFVYEKINKETHNSVVCKQSFC